MPSYADFRTALKAGAGAPFLLWHLDRKESLQVISYNDAARRIALRTYTSYGRGPAFWAAANELAFVSYTCTDELLRAGDLVITEGCVGTVVEIREAEDHEPDPAWIVWRDLPPSRPDRVRRLTPLEILALHG